MIQRAIPLWGLAAILNSFGVTLGTEDQEEFSAVSAVLTQAGSLTSGPPLVQVYGTPGSTITTDSEDPVPLPVAMGYVYTNFSYVAVLFLINLPKIEEELGREIPEIVRVLETTIRTAFTSFDAFRNFIGELLLQTVLGLWEDWHDLFMELWRLGNDRDPDLGRLGLVILSNVPIALPAKFFVGLFKKIERTARRLERVVGSGVARRAYMETVRKGLSTLEKSWLSRGVDPTIVQRALEDWADNLRTISYEIDSNVSERHLLGREHLLRFEAELESAEVLARYLGRVREIQVVPLHMDAASVVNYRILTAFSPNDTWANVVVRSPMRIIPGYMPEGFQSIVREAMNLSLPDGYVIIAADEWKRLVLQQNVTLRLANVRGEIERQLHSLRGEFNEYRQRARPTVVVSMDGTYHFFGIHADSAGVHLNETTSLAGHP